MDIFEGTLFRLPQEHSINSIVFHRIDHVKISDRLSLKGTLQNERAELFKIVKNMRRGKEELLQIKGNK